MASLSLFSLFPFLVLALSVCHGALTFQDYWNHMLPNTPMPAAVRDHLGEPVAESRRHEDAENTKPGVISGKPVTKGDKGVDAGVLDTKPNLFCHSFHTTKDLDVVTGVDGEPVKVDLSIKPALLYSSLHAIRDSDVVTGVDGESVKVDLGIKPALLYSSLHAIRDSDVVTGVDGEPVKVDLDIKPALLYSSLHAIRDSDVVTGVDGEPVKVDLGTKPALQYNSLHVIRDPDVVTGVDGEPVKVDLGTKPALQYNSLHVIRDPDVVTGVDGEPVKVDLATKPALHYSSLHATDVDDKPVKVDGIESNLLPVYSRKVSFGTSTRSSDRKPAVNYHSAAHGGRIDHPKSAAFFLQRDLHVGAQMNMPFDRGLTGDRLLHREVAETIPFSFKEFPEILRRFAIPSGSSLANKFENTIRMCEIAPSPSEKKQCVTSLESMVEFVISTSGTNDLQTLTTVIRKDAPMQLYTVQSWTVMPTPDWNKVTVCHVEKYPYTVFHCHKMPQVTPYVLNMVGEDGTPVEAATICHSDTSEWAPTSNPLRWLKLRPGETTVCHLLPDGDVAWFPRSDTKTADAAM